MIDRIAIGVASAAALLLCTACAATPEQANEAREQKIRGAFLASPKLGERSRAASHIYILQD